MANQIYFENRSNCFDKLRSLKFTAYLRKKKQINFHSPNQIRVRFIYQNVDRRYPRMKQLSKTRASRKATLIPSSEIRF